MIDPAPYDALAAQAIMRAMDTHDFLEAQHLRGRTACHAQLFAEWHAAQAGAVLSLIVKSDAGMPVALLVVGNTGQAGVAQAALVARDHRRYRRELAALTRAVADELPAFCRKLGIHRIEARAWARHPRAGRFLRRCGFRLEAEMAGFGADGAETFLQFAWVAPPPPIQRSGQTGQINRPKQPERRS